MTTNYVIKNFRIFGEDGASFEISPITMLTGCNSSGKSSVVKSMMLLKDCIERASDAYSYKHHCNPAEWYIDFSLLGVNLKSFDSALNRNAQKRTMTFAYDVEGSVRGFVGRYNVQLEFSEKDNDMFHYGWLTNIQVSIVEDKEKRKVLSASVVKGRDVMTIDYLNIDGFVQESFLCYAYASTLSYFDEKRGECFVDPYEECLAVPHDEYDILVKKRDELLNLTNRRGYGNLIGLLYNLISKADYGKEHSKIYRKNFEQALKICENDYIIFYFPVLEKLRGITKSEVRDILLQINLDEQSEYDKEEFREQAIKIADAFNNSEYDSFLDFYRSFEDSELNDVVKHLDKRYMSMFSNFRTNFFSGVELCAERHYDRYHFNFLYSSSNAEEVDFSLIYRFFAQWQLNEGNDPELLDVSVDMEGTTVSHIYYGALVDFLIFTLEKVLLPNFESRLKYIGNFQSEVKRLYSFDDKSNNMGNALRLFIENKAKFNSIGRGNSDSKYKPCDFINKWLKKLNIGSSLNIIEDTDRLGAKLYIRKNKDRIGTPLADEGYGISQFVTFLLYIENEILINKINEMSSPKKWNPDMENLINDMFKLEPIPTLAIEEPEVSLHPSMQSSLADVFYDAYLNYGIHFIIETHSEYLIRRTQAIVAGYKSSEEFNHTPFLVHYVDKGGKAYKLVYKESGRFENSFGKGFFDEASRSSLQILKRERRMNYE